MSIHDSVARLSDGIRMAVARQYARYEAGRTDWDTFANLAAQTIARDASRAAALAELHISTELLRDLGVVETAQGLNIDYAAKQSSARGALDDQRSTQSYAQNPREAVGIAASDQVMDTYQETAQEAMRAKGVEYFRRVANPGACDICLGFADRGPYPVGENLWRHKGCMCVETPIN